MFDTSMLLGQLNDDQRRAATHSLGPLLVLAGAGTGKTATLAARVGWLRASGLAADRILLLTFTRRAADDMLGRVGAWKSGRLDGWVAAGAGEPGRPDSGGPTGGGTGAGGTVWGGTFHAIAHRIIRAHAEAFSLPPAFSLIDPADTADLLDVPRAGPAWPVPSGGHRAGRCAPTSTRAVSIPSGQ